ncbi:MAG TPA: 4-hydroxy-tetrahydrodipicolinate reductase [Candidatus Obscuribacterales bacterium]
MGEKVRVAIAGINGRFGRASARAVLEDPDLELVGAFGRSNAPYIGKDVGELASTLKTGILVSSGFLDLLARAKPDLLLDFSVAEAALSHAKLALEKGVRPVIGTTGISEQDVDELARLAAKHNTPGMLVSNFSLGAVLMMEFARQAGAYYEHAEIVEMHHTRKLDAPSGTAMRTVAKIAASGNRFNRMEVDEKEILAGARGGEGAGGVRVHSLRLPGLMSHHEVVFGSDGELLTIRHDAFNTNCYIKGILLALKRAMTLDRFVVGLENLLVSTAS